MTDKRNFNQSQRKELFLKADGKCQICSCDISLDNFHADHKIPFCEGGKTELNNGQALCPQCNLKKASLFNIDVSHYMEPGKSLRDWQAEFLPRCYRSMVQQIGKPQDEIKAFMLHAFPGSGKTKAALILGALLKEQGFIEKIIVNVPSLFLKDQMEKEARKIGLMLNKKKIFVEGFDGLVTSYASIGYKSKDTDCLINAEIINDICKRFKVLVIADECHHLSQEKRWGEAFELAYGNSVARLMTSGTPFRTDRRRLPWVRYSNNELDLSQPHAYSYPYGITKWNSKYCALGDQVVRDVVIRSWNSDVNFTLTEERGGEILNVQEFNHKLTDNIDEIYPDVYDPETEERIEDNSRLRKLIKTARRSACIECGTDRHPFGTEFIRKILIAANEQLDDCRRAHEWAGGLIVCDNIDHANSIAVALKHWTKEDAIVVHTESGNSKRAIEGYKDAKNKKRNKWLISVGQVSEGVDIPHLRVGVYLTTTQSHLRWLQILGRVLRTEPELTHEMQTAYFYQYDDGIELVEDDNGIWNPESVNIKLFAESLMKEKVKFQSVLENNRERNNSQNNINSGQALSIKTETHSANGKETHHIYDGQRIDIKDLDKYKIASSRTSWPPAKLKIFIEKIGQDELRRILS